MQINIIVPTYNDKEIHNFIDCFNKSVIECSDQLIKLHLVIANDHHKSVTGAFRKFNPNVTEVQTSIDQWWTKSILVGLDCSKKINSDLTIIATSDVSFNGAAIKDLTNFMKLNKDITVCHPRVLCTKTKNEVISAKKLLISKKLYFPKSIFALNEKSEVDMLSGRFAVIRSEIFNKITFDEHLIHYAADYDFFIRASRHGHKLVITNEATVNVDSTRTGQGKSNILTYKQYLESFKNIKSRNYFKSLKYFYLKNFGLIYGCTILCAKISFDFIYLTFKKIGFIK